MPVRGSNSNSADQSVAALAKQEPGPELPEITVKRHALKGQFLKAKTASYPFLYSGDMSSDNGMPASVRNLPTHALEHLRGNVRLGAPEQARAFQKGELKNYLQKTTNAIGRPLVPTKAETTQNARWRSLIKRFGESNKIKEQGFSETSPLARMNRAAVPRSMQRSFFRERARDQGFRGNDDTYNDNNALEWLKSKKADLLDIMGKSTKQEHAYSALEMARAKASSASLAEHAQDRNIQKLKENKDQARADTSKSARHGRADFAEESLEYRDHLKLLTDGGIEAGVQELNYFLDPEHDAEKHFEDASERNQIVTQFRKTCHDYNASVLARIEARNRQRDALAETPLPHLGLPVELRGDAIANGFFSDARNSIEKERGWTPDSTFKGWFKGIAKDVAAVIGTLVVVPLLFSGWRDFVASRFSASYRLREVASAALEQQVHELKLHNQKQAENWVRKTYQYNPDGATKRTAHSLKLDDPHGLFAAFANFSREDIVDAVKQQLALSAEADLLEAREKRAKDLGVDVNDKSTNIPYTEHYVDDYYLSELAEGIVDGMEIALGDALVEQIKARHDGLLTTTANAFVDATDTQVDLMCNRAWDAAHKMLNKNLYSETRNADFNRVLDGQMQHLRDIEEEVALAKQGPVHAGKIPGLRGTLDIPNDGPRMKHIDETLAFAQTELGAARDAADFINGMLGQATSKGSLLWIDSELDSDAVGAGLESGDTEAKCKTAYDNLDDLIKKQVAHLNENSDLLTDELHEELDDMLSNLKSRSANQRHIRQAVIDLDRKIRDADSPEDLANLDADFKQDVTHYINLMAITANWGKNAAIEAAIASNTERRDETISRLNSTRQLMQAHEGAVAAADGIVERIGNNELPLDIGLAQIDQAFKPFVEANEKHQEKWSAYDKIGNKFTDTEREISNKHAQALMAALQINSEKRNLPPEALPKIDLMYKAGVLNDNFAAAFRKDLQTHTRTEDNTPTASELAEAISKLGTDQGGKNFAAKFASYLYHQEPDRRLKLTLDILRQAGADANELRQAKRKHYSKVARETLMGTVSSGALSKAFQTIDRYPLDLRGQLDAVEGLFQKYPSLFSEQDVQKMRDAIGNLRALIFDPKKPLTDTEISQAVALVERLADIDDQKNFDTKTIEAECTKSEHKRSGKLQNQIASVFGFEDAGAFNDAERVKEGIDLIINGKSNRSELQDITARSAHIQSLIQTQQESAQLLEGAVLKPLKEFARKLKLDATSADARNLMESEDFREKAHVLEDLNRLLVADERVRNDLINGNTDNDIYNANLKALTRLSQELRQFDPQTMKASGNSVSNRLAMWWNNEVPEDIVQDLKAKGSEDIAKKFVDVWKHLVTLNALSESNDDLSTEIQALAKQRNTLMTEVQQHRSNQLAMMAALREFDQFGGAAKDFKLTKERVARIQATLTGWGQSGAWQTLCDHYDVEADDFSQDLLNRWSADCNGLPADIQRDFDKLNAALSDFETLVKSLAKSNAAMVGTDLAADKLPSPDEQKRISDMLQEQLLRIKRTRANMVLKNLLHSVDDWSKHPSWTVATTLEDLSKQRLNDFHRSFTAALTESYPYDKKAGALIRLINKAADFDQEARAAKGVTLCGMAPSKHTLNTLNTMAESLRNAAKEARPSKEALHALNQAENLADKDLLDFLTLQVVTDIDEYVAQQMTYFDPNDMTYFDPNDVDVISLDDKHGAAAEHSEAAAASPRKRVSGFMRRLRDNVAEATSALPAAHIEMEPDLGNAADMNVFTDDNT